MGPDGALELRGNRLKKFIIEQRGLSFQDTERRSINRNEFKLIKNKLIFYTIPHPATGRSIHIKVMEREREREM